MEDSMANFIIMSLSFFSLLIIASFAFLFSKKINFPYTVLLFIIGLILVPLSYFPVFSRITSFQLTPEILFFVFLPILVFESAYNINYKDLFKNGTTIFTLAFVGLLISTFTIAYSLYYILNFIGMQVHLGVTILFGAIISSIDPVAVLALFKSSGAPRKLSLIFEGESLFNDATSLALFLIVVSILREISIGNSFELNTHLINGSISFLSMMFGGIILGGLIGYLFSYIIGKIKNVEEVEMTLTIALAHIAFLTAEFITHFTIIDISGIVCTAIAGVIAGNYGRHKISPKIEEHMDKLWEYSAWLVNSLVFILMGLILVNIDINFLEFIPIIAITIIIVIISRGLSVYIPLFFLGKIDKSSIIPISWQHLLAWGSLRGALGLMMVLIIPEGLTLSGWGYEYSIKDFLTVLVVSSVIFSLIIKSLTIVPLMKKLKINEIHSLEKFEYYEGIILALLKVFNKLEQNYQAGYLLEDEYKELNIKYQKKFNSAIEGMQNLLKTEKDGYKLITKALSLHALGIEKQSLKKLFLSNEIDENNYRILLGKIQRQKTRLENGLKQFSGNKDYYTDKKDIFENLVEKSFDKNSPINSYIRNRARVIVIKDTINQLNELKNTDFKFNKKYFDNIIELYKDLLQISDKKNKKLINEYKTTIMSLETKLSEKTLLRIEENVINSLYEKEIITPKLYHKFIEDIENGIYK
ncbi:cation:proton antiporter [Candidatus Vampirococcus lugosii]|uniref:Sodium/hydrogen exchanger n=1 Tax=Candidatus Vampirococcus lugosii TaxID=2789015 RepID=A0ABS5QK66_9BACT|nr:sodium:proton antiporter [Candidatus Vampirococcus lugosii]MBS8121434.1 sodium/hydrogen exchanger [Candidatus Vampirococcus lugosii]